MLDAENKLDAFLLQVTMELLHFFILFGSFTNVETLRFSTFFMRIVVVYLPLM